MEDYKTWSDLADECAAKGIKVEPGEKAASLKEKLAATKKVDSKK